MKSLIDKKLKIAVIFHQEISFGGGFQQSINSALLMKKLPNKLISTIFFTIKRKNTDVLKKYDIDSTYLNLSILSKLIIFLKTEPRFIIFKNLMMVFNIKSSFEKKLLKNNIDLVYFLSPTRLAVDLEKINYIYTVWDICHRDQMEFPEVRSNGIFEFRDNLCKIILPKAQSIIVDSEYSKENIEKKYSIDKKRMHVIPFEAAYKIKVNNNNESRDKEFSINDKTYIYYPAQFWAHKNHTYIIDGIISLEKKYGYKINIIFSGSDKGNLSYVKEYAKYKRVYSRVSFLGFVSDEKIITLYKNSLALVMPTYFGPTNIPPLEAFQLGVPVLYSNIYSNEKQIKDAGLAIDLNDENSLADQLYRLITIPSLRAKLIKKGYQKIKKINSNSRLALIENILKEFYRKKITYK